MGQEEAGEQSQVRKRPLFNVQVLHLGITVLQHLMQCVALQCSARAVFPRWTRLNMTVCKASGFI